MVQGHRRIGTRQPLPIAALLGEGLRLADAVEHLVRLAECEQSIGQRQADINDAGDLARVVTEMVERRLRLAVGIDGLRRRRPLERQVAQSMVVLGCLVPKLAAEGMSCEPLVPARELVAAPRLQDVDDTLVEDAPLLAQHIGVRDLLGQRMMEQVFPVRVPAHLVEKLGLMQAEQAGAEIPLRAPGDRLEDVDVHAPPDDSRDLEQVLVGRLEPIDARGERRLNGRRGSAAPPARRTGGSCRGCVAAARAQPVRAHSPRGRTDCRWCARSARPSADRGAGLRRAARSAVRATSI